MSDSHTAGPRSPYGAENGSTSAQVPPTDGASPAGAPPAVNGSVGGREDEASPEEIGAALMHRLDTLDDRLRRSQEKMIALLDRKLEEAAATAPARPGGVPEQARWAVSPPAVPSPFEAPYGVSADDPMETWFNAAPPKVGTDLFDDVPAAPARPASGSAAPSPVKPVVHPGVPEEADEASTGPVMASPPMAEAGPTATAPGAEEQAEEPKVSPAQVGEIVQSRRPAWQSNLLTAVVAAIVIVVALFLVGLF